MINSKHYYLDGIVSCPCNKIYKRSLFDTVRFIGRYGEDYGVADLLYAKNIRIKICKETYYIYSFQNQGSLTRGKFNTNKFDFLDVLYKRTEIYNDYPDIKNKTYKNTVICFWNIMINLKKPVLKYLCNTKHGLINV